MILLSNVVVDVTVDRLVTWNELMPDRLTVAAARLDGVLPLAPAWLAGRFPDLWATRQGGEARRSRGLGQTPQTPNKNSYLGFEAFAAVLPPVGSAAAPVPRPRPSPTTRRPRPRSPPWSGRWRCSGGRVEAPPEELEAAPPAAGPSLPCRSGARPSDSWHPRTPGRAPFDVAGITGREPRGRFTFRGAGPGRPAATVEGVLAGTRSTAVVVEAIARPEPGSPLEVADARHDPDPAAPTAWHSTAARGARFCVRACRAGIGIGVLLRRPRLAGRRTARDLV